MTHEEKRKPMIEDILTRLDKVYRPGSGQYKLVKEMLETVKYDYVNGLWCLIFTSLHPWRENEK